MPHSERGLERLKGCLGNAKFAYTITYSNALKASPFTLLYGRDPHTMVLADSVNENTPSIPTSTSKDVKSLFTKINQLRNYLISKNIPNRSQVVENSIMKRGSKPTDLVVGDIVYRKKQSNEKANKLDSKYEGPYKIIRKNTSGSYAIKGFDNIERILNRKDLKLVIEDMEEPSEEGDM